MLQTFFLRKTSVRKISAWSSNRLPFTPTLSSNEKISNDSKYSKLLPLKFVSPLLSSSVMTRTSQYQQKSDQILQLNKTASLFLKSEHSIIETNPFLLNPQSKHFLNVEHFDLKLNLLRKHSSLWRHVILSADMSKTWKTLPGFEIEKYDHDEHLRYHLEQVLNDISCIPLNLIENSNNIELLCVKYQIPYYMLDDNGFVFYCPDIATRKKILSSINDNTVLIQEKLQTFDENEDITNEHNQDDRSILDEIITNNAYEPSLESASTLYNLIKRVSYKENNNINVKKNKIKSFSLNNGKIMQQILNEICLFIPSLSKPLSREELLEVFLQSNLSQSALDELEPFYLINLGDVIRQHIQWCELLPRVKPFYAIKCNPNPIIIRLLHLLGCGFDCASVPEFQLLFENKLIPKYKFDYTDKKDLALYDNKLIYSNPCKDPMHLQYANENGIRLMTFDSEYELEKIKKYHPFAKVLMRIQADDSHSICQFNSKFGVTDNMIETLFEKCAKLELNLGGIMFHVGSGCMKASVYKEVIGKARYYMDIAQNKYGFEDCNVLDLGGGYPGVDNPNLILFSDIAKQINQGLNDYFYNDNNFLSKNPKFQCIAEPGRYYVAKSHNLICSVIGKKKNKENYCYTINDGIYGSFNCIIFDHQLPTILPLNNNSNNNNDNSKLYSSTVFGPTCDSMDRLVENVNLPELNIGNKIIVPNFGAYTNAAATTFNGFPKSKLFYALTIN